MSAAVDEVRAMLALFAKSRWRDLHLRSGGWEIFLAKPGGAANPMVAAAAAATAEIIATLEAPHLGLFYADVATGDTVAEGTVLGQLEVLGEREDLRAERPGRVAAILAEDGALVEYGIPLIRLAA